MDDDPDEEGSSKERSQTELRGPVSVAELVAADFERPLESELSIDCAKLGHLYGKAARTAESDADKRVFSLLEDVTSIHFKPEDRSEPYGPMLVMDGRRSIIPDDLRGEQSETFAALAARTKNSGLRARLADIVWLNDRKRADLGRLAIASYVESIMAVHAGRAQHYFEDERAWSRNGVQLARRASQIATAIGWKGTEAEELRAAIETIFEAAVAANSGDGVDRFGELKLDYGMGEPTVIAIAAEKIAASQGLHPDSKRSLWELAARAYAVQSNEAERNRCLLQAAETFASMAESADSQGMVAASWLMKAIEGMRQLPGTKTRREELEVRLRKAQENIADEMGSFSTEIDLTDLVDAARKAVADLTLSAAFREFAKLDGSRLPEALREEVLKQAKANPISHIVPMAVHDDEGKLVAQSPGMMGNAEDQERAIRYSIIQNERLRRQVTVQGLIEPARRRIMQEHPLVQRHFWPLCEMSPLVPRGSEYVFSLGFARFFGGDFASALSLLGPQLENCLRYALKQSAIDASRIQPDMTQESRTLSIMLDRDRSSLEKIFGLAIVFEIENLFDFRGGPALRHGLAHGLISDNEFGSPDAIYACWFMFRLCCLPLFKVWQSVASAYESIT